MSKKPVSAKASDQPAPFLERERKYRLHSAEDIEDIFAEICADRDHFVPVSGDVLDIKPPRTGARVRVYYDTPRLALANNRIEARVQPDKCKMTFKVGASGSAEDPTLSRHEYVREFDPRKGPSLGLIRDLGASFLQGITNKQDLNKVTLLPLVRSVSQRTRLTYYPDNDRDNPIEIAGDTYCVTNIVGNSEGQGFSRLYHLFEVEAKNQNADPAILDREATYLADRFNRFGLAAEYRSKPSEAFDHLRPYVAALDKGGRAWLRNQLGDGNFHALPARDGAFIVK